MRSSADGKHRQEVDPRGMRAPRSLRPIHLYLAYLAAALAAIVAFSLLGQGPLRVGLYSGIGLAAAAALFAGARPMRRRAAWPWLSFGIGIAFLIAGDTYWDVRDLLGWATPTPSPADALYLLGYPFLAAGFILLLRAGTPGSVRTKLLDAAIVSLALAVVLWGPFYTGFRQDPGAPLSERATLAADPTWDLLLLALGTGFVFTRSLRRPWAALLLLAAALLLDAAAARKPRRIPTRDAPVRSGA